MFRKKACKKGKLSLKGGYGGIEGMDVWTHSFLTTALFGNLRFTLTSRSLYLGKESTSSRLVGSFGAGLKILEKTVFCSCQDPNPDSSSLWPSYCTTSDEHRTRDFSSVRHSRCVHVDYRSG